MCVWGVWKIIQSVFVWVSIYTCLLIFISVYMYVCVCACVWIEKWWCKKCFLRVKWKIVTKPLYKGHSYTNYICFCDYYIYFACRCVCVWVNKCFSISGKNGDCCLFFSNHTDSLHLSNCFIFFLFMMILIFFLSLFFFVTSIFYSFRLDVCLIFSSDEIAAHFVKIWCKILLISNWLIDYCF